MDEFLARVKTLYDSGEGAFVAVSEGIHDKDGVFISEYASKGGKDAFGHVQLGGLAAYLANRVKEHCGAKVRGIELSLLQRCGAHLASKTDIDEAVLAGKTAVEAAVSGESGKMVAFERAYVDGKYSCKTKLIPLTQVANYESKVPLEWILPQGAGVTQDFIDYVLPLIQGDPQRKEEHSLPRFARLKKVRA
jgi:6-phosphofructokinase 1